MRPTQSYPRDNYSKWKISHLAIGGKTNKAFFYLRKNHRIAFVWHFDWIFVVYGASRWFHSRSSRKFQLCNCSVTHQTNTAWLLEAMTTVSRAKQSAKSSKRTYAAAYSGGLSSFVICSRGELTEAVVLRFHDLCHRIEREMRDRCKFDKPHWSLRVTSRRLKSAVESDHNLSDLMWKAIGWISAVGFQGIHESLVVMTSSPETEYFNLKYSRSLNEIDCTTELDTTVDKSHLNFAELSWPLRSWLGRLFDHIADWAPTLRDTRQGILLSVSASLKAIASPHSTGNFILATSKQRTESEREGDVDYNKVKL